MRILLIYSALSSGEFAYAGMEKMMVWLANAISESKHEIIVCTLYDKKANNSINESIKTIPLGIHYSSSFLLRNLRLFFYVPFVLKKILSKYSVDYVISFGDSAFFPAVLLRKICGYKLIVSERGDPNNSSGFLESLRQNLIRFSDVAVFQTKGAEDYYSKVIGLRVKKVIIPNPISLPQQQWESYNSKTVLSVGRLDLRQKRQDLLIDAYNIVHKKFPDWKLVICGSGSDRLLIEDRLKEYGLSYCIDMPGAVNNVKDYMLRSSIFVLTSDFEGIPNALLEAMAIGMPVVSTDCSPGGAALLIEDGKNGLLVKRGDKNAIANAINRLISNSQEAKMMGAEARKSMLNYSPAAIKEQWLNLFEQ